MEATVRKPARVLAPGVCPAHDMSCLCERHGPTLRNLGEKHGITITAEAPHASRSMACSLISSALLATSMAAL